MTGRIFTIERVPTIRRDVDLFGATTVRIDARRDAASAGVPMLYLSAFVDDPDGFAQKIVAALAWVMDGRAQVSEARAGEVANNPSPEASVYSMPDFLEDVDWSEVLHLADPVEDTDWKAWAAAVERRIRLAQTGAQLAAMQTANALGIKACPVRYRAQIGQRLQTAYQETAGQDLAA